MYLPTEFEKKVEEIKKLAGFFGAIKPERIASYASGLKDFSVDAVNQACERLKNTSDRFPSFATLKVTAAEYEVRKRVNLDGIDYQKTNIFNDKQRQAIMMAMGDVFRNGKGKELQFLDRMKNIKINGCNICNESGYVFAYKKEKNFNAEYSFLCRCNIGRTKKEVFPLWSVKHEKDGFFLKNRSI